MPRRIVAKPEQKLTGVVNQEADRTPRHDVPRAWWCEENIIFRSVRCQADSRDS